MKKDSSKIRLTSQIARAVLRVVRAGLISGPGLQVKGKFVPGSVCVKQAISHALGTDHENDHPRCVGDAMNAFEIQLNDQNWSDNAARAKGMEKLAVAELGSNRLDSNKFYELMCMEFGVEPESAPECPDDDYNPFTGRMETLVMDRLDTLGMTNGGMTNGKGDQNLNAVAKSGLKILMKMKSPGCKYLYLFQE